MHTVWHNIFGNIFMWDHPRVFRHELIFTLTNVYAIFSEDVPRLCHNRTPSLIEFFFYHFCKLKCCTHYIIYWENNMCTIHIFMKILEMCVMLTYSELQKSFGIFSSHVWSYVMQFWRWLIAFDKSKDISHRDMSWKWQFQYNLRKKAHWWIFQVCTIFRIGTEHRDVKNRVRFSQRYCDLFDYKPPWSYLYGLLPYQGSLRNRSYSYRLPCRSYK